MFRNIVLIGCLVLSCSVVNAQGVKNQGADAPRSPKKTQPAFELKDGDRVVFLGNTLIERAQKYGYWETMLTARYPDRKIIFRNLGWDGDTVWAESRGIFDPPAKGYARMLDRVAGIKPTVIFVGYGNNEVHAGKKGLPRFIKQYNKLLDDLTKVSAKDVRFVLLSPIPTFQKDGANWKPSSVDSNVKLYANVIKELAGKRESMFIDLYSKLMEFTSEVQKKDRDSEVIPSLYERNGIHLSSMGYGLTAKKISDGLFGKTERVAPELVMTSSGNVKTVRALRVANAKPIFNGLRWQQTVEHNVLSSSLFQLLKVTGLKKGPYILRINGVSTGLFSGAPVLQSKKSVTSAALANGVYLADGHSFDDSLIRRIIAKNRLYFHSWRPQNITYLFLFRKHEQGQNAKEVKEFLKIVAEKEKEIDRLKKPITRTYELIRVKPKTKKK